MPVTLDELEKCDSSVIGRPEGLLHVPGQEIGSLSRRGIVQRDGAGSRRVLACVQKALSVVRKRELGAFLRHDVRYFAMLENDFFGGADIGNVDRHLKLVMVVSGGFFFSVSSSSSGLVIRGYRSAAMRAQPFNE